jgi:arsenate reductase
MYEIGIDISRQRPKAARQLLGRLPAVFLIVVCSGDEAPTVWPNVLSRDLWPLRDPVAAEGTDEEKLAAFREVRDELKGRIEAWVASRGR